jgi:hypothetical protein
VSLNVLKFVISKPQTVRGFRLPLLCRRLRSSGMLLSVCSWSFFDVSGQAAIKLARWMCSPQTVSLPDKRNRVPNKGQWPSYFWFTYGHSLLPRTARSVEGRPVNIKTQQNVEGSGSRISEAPGICLQRQKYQRTSAWITGLGAVTCTLKVPEYAAQVLPTCTRHSVVAYSERLPVEWDLRNSGR